MQLEKANPKMGFWRAKQGLSKTRDLKAKLVSIGERNKNVKEEKKRRGRGRRRREEEKEEIKPRYGTLIFVWN